MKLLLIVMSVFLFSFSSCSIRQYWSPEISKEFFELNRNKKRCLEAVGYSWCEISQECMRIQDETCEKDTEEIEKVRRFLNSLTFTTKIVFSPIENSLFIWKFSNQQSTTVTGLKYSAAVGQAQSNSVKNYFIKKKFEVDINNVSAGSVSSIFGYNDGSFACVIKEYKAANSVFNPLAGSITDLEINCGYIDQ